MHLFGFSLQLYAAFAIANCSIYWWLEVWFTEIYSTKLSIVLPMSERFSRCIPIFAPFWSKRMFNERYLEITISFGNANANPLKQKWVLWHGESYPMNSFKGQQSVGNQSQSVRDLRLAFLHMIVWITNTHTHTNLCKAGRILFCQNLPKEGLGPLFCVWSPPRPTIYVSRHWQVSASFKRH